MKKIPTIFKRSPENMREITNEPHQDCKWVFDGEGVATRKYDGTCCKIDDDGFWKRREVKRGKPDPGGFVLEQEDTNTGKRVGWVKVSPEDEADRWHMEAYDGCAHLRGTFELCGPKVQGNPEATDVHVLIPHADAQVLELHERTYKGIKDFMADKDIEGIVFHHEDGRMAKIKKRDYGQKRS